MHRINSGAAVFFRIFLIAIVLINAMSPTSFASARSVDVDNISNTHKQLLSSLWNDFRTGFWQQTQIGEPDPFKSSLFASDPVRADGSQVVTITAVISDEQSNPVDNARVIFLVSGEDTLIEYLQSATDVNGVIRAELRSTQPGPKSITAQIVTGSLNVSIQQTVLAIFTGAQISGIVYNDKNANGQLDVIEKGVIGIPVYLFNAENILIASAATTLQGNYAFDGLQAGAYKIAVKPNNSFDAKTNTKNLTLNSFQTSSGNDFGLFESAIIEGQVWDDVNQNQVIDNEEKKLEGVTVSALGQSGAIKSTVTEIDGVYSLKIPVTHPKAPANFNFDALAHIINPDIRSEIFNSDFESPIGDIDSNNFLENYNFASTGYQLDVSASPVNHDFENTGYLLNSDTFPSNYDFEIGSLGDWLSDICYVVEGGYDSSYALYKPIGTVGTVISPVFTIPADAQSLTWQWIGRDYWGGNTSFYLTDASTGETLVTMYSNRHTSGYWHQYNYNVSEYVGREVRFKVENTDSNEYFYLDDIRFEVNVPGWEIAGNMNATTVVEIVEHDGSNRLYRPIGTTGSLTSPAFTIPADAQSLTWQWIGRDYWGGNTSFYLLDASTGETLVTMYSNRHTSGYWHQYNYNVSEYVGREVRFKVENTDSNEYFYLDDIRFEVNVPGWEIAGNMNATTVAEIVEHDGSNRLYRPIGTTGSLTSPAFMIPADAQSLTWQWIGRDYWGGNTSFYLLDASTGETLVTMYSNRHTSGYWHQYNYNVSEYVGREVRFKVENTDSNEYFYLDDIRFEVNVPGWEIAGNMNATTVAEIVEHDGSNRLYRPIGTTGSLTSPAFTIPADAQSLTWQWIGRDYWGGNTSFYLLDASTGETLLTMYSNRATNGYWHQYSYNVSGYEGREVRFKVENTDSNEYFYLDDIRFEVNVPGWEIAGNMNATTVVEIVEHDGSNRLYRPIGTTGSLTSPAFTIPADAQSLTWQWIGRDYWGGNTSFYLLDASTGETLVTMYSNRATNGYWHQYSYNVSEYVGQEIRFKVENTDANEYFYLDDILITPHSTAAYSITQENLPGYKSSTPDTVEVSLYGGQRQIINFGDFTIDLGQSTLAVEPVELTANGVDSAQVVVTIVDGMGNPMPDRKIEVETNGVGVTVTQPMRMTDVQGQVTAMISSTVAQTVSVKARDVAENVILTDVKQVIFTPGAVDASQSIIVVTPGYVSANGSMTGLITVILNDMHNNPVAGHQVEITHDSENISLNISSPISNEQGQVTATIHATSPQLVTIQARDVTTDTQLVSSGIVTFVATDPAQSTISVSPASISADNLDDAEITITLKDSAGQLVANAPVEIQISGTDNVLDGQPIGDAPVGVGNTDANGTIVTHLASTQAETKTITVVGQHIQIDQTGEVVVRPGAASASVSVLGIAPAQVIADGQQTAVVILTLKDSQGNLIPGHDISVTATGIHTQIEMPQPARTDTNGKLIARITSTELGEAAISVQDTTDQVAIGQPITVEFIAGPADPVGSSVEVTAGNLVANGTDSATITILLQDSVGHVLPGHEVQLTVSGSGNTISGPVPATTDADGIIVFTVSSTRAEQKTITITDRTDNVTLNEKPVLTFVSGPISLQNSRIETSLTEVGADGETPATITVTALDAFNNPIQNLDVTLLASGNAVVTQPASPTDANGKAAGQVTNANIETVTVSARVNGEILSGIVQVAFKGADLAVSLAATGEVAPEGTIRYSLLVKNIGNLTAENVGLTLTLPAELSLVNHTASSEPEQQGSNLVWSLGSIPSGEQIAYDVTVQASADAAVGASLNTTLATITSTLEANTSNNQASINTTIVPAYNFSASLTPASASLSLGGSATYFLSVVNTGQKSDSFDFSVTGLDSSWVTFAPASTSLAPGAAATIGVTVTIAACMPQQAVSFDVNVTSTTDAKSVAATLNILAAPEIIVNAPGENSISGSRTVLLSWRTTTETTGSIEIYPAGNPEQTQTANTAQGTLHTVQVDSLVRNQSYEWKITATSPCGTTTVTRHFSVGNGIVFVNRSQSYTIDRDYEQRLQVGVRNDDSVPHTLTTTILNSREDLIINFVESGSTDQTVTLQPGESKNLALVVHAQDTELRDYQVLAHLVSEQEGADPITDNALLNIKVLAEGDYSIVEDTAAFDPLTLGKTYVITNHGSTITDLSLKAVDPDTGLPANVLIQPSIDHARLQTGQSVRVVVYPIFGPEDVTQESGSNLQDNSLHLATFSDKPGLSSSRQAAAAKNFTLQGNGAGHTVSVSSSTTCPAGKQIYPVQINNATCEFTSNDWYCTNRPNIVTPLAIPAFLNQASIESASLGMQFAPRNKVLPHSGSISVNGTQIGSFSETIPDGNFTFNIPPQSLNSGVAGLATQNIELNTLHNNSGHYVSSSNYVLGIGVRQATTYACASSAETARQAVMSTYACRPSYGFNPWTDIYPGSTLNWGEIKSIIRSTAEEKGYEISTVSCSQAGVGDPINTRTGVFSIAIPDISFPTSAGTLAFQRAYSSGTIDLYNEALSYGWTHNHDSRLIFPTDSSGLEGFVLFQDYLGNRHLFSIEPDGSYRPGPGVLAVLTPHPDPLPGGEGKTYTLTTPEQTKLEFDADGRILSRADSNGHRFDYTYDGEGKLTRIGTGQGDTLRFLDLAYDDQGRIVSVTDYTGRQVTYTYDAAGDLASSTNLLERAWTYAYDSGHRMTQLNDPAGKETVMTEYDMNGRAWRQFDGEGNLLVRIVFNPDGSTTVYDAEGNTREFSSDQRCIVTEKLDELGRVTNTEYDANFLPTEITNAAGHTLEMEWSEDGRNLLSKTDPGGHTTTYAYDELNNLTATTDPLGNVTTYTYTGKLLTGKTSPDGKTTAYTYTAQGWLETEIDPYGRVTTYTYDPHGQKTSVTDWRGRSTTYVYDDLGRLVETSDQRGRISRSEYNQAGQLLRSISNYDPNRPQNDQNLYNIITSYEYDLRGNQVAVTDTLGRVTHYEYDDADRLVRTIDPAGNVTTNTYDANGRLTSSTDALGNLTSYVYDEVGRRLTTINALGHSSGTTTFNIPANTSTAIDALGRPATYHYDELNRVVKVVDPLGNQTTTTYHPSGQVATRTDQLGRVTNYEYDSLGRLVRTIDPLGGVTQTVYDEHGNRVATIDPLGNQTTYTYDSQGRLLTTTDPLGHATSNQYDEDGNLVAVTDALGRATTTEYDQWGRRTATVDAAGRRTTYTYDVLDRVISVTGPTGTTTTTYDALGNNIARTDEHGRVSTTTYDLLGRVVSTTDFNGNTTTHQYDAAGNLIATTDTQGTTTYTYDALNRRVSTTDPLGNTSSVAYDRLGNVTHETDANGVVTYYGYDLLNRKTMVIYNYKPAIAPDSETNVRVEYTYNAVGNRTQVRDANGNITQFQYDALNRVTRKIDPIGNTWQYEYDLVGNMLSRTDGNGKTTAFTYNALGQLTLIDYPSTGSGQAPAPDPDVSFTYNALGQRVSMTDGLGTTTWQYDALGRLESVTDPYSKAVSYAYDEHGNRTGLIYPDGKQVAYNYDQDNRLAEVASWDSNATEYEYDSLGQLLSILRPNGVASAYTFDQAGRLALLEHTAAADTLARYEYTYDAVGNIVQAVERVAGGAATGPTVLLTVVDTEGTPLAGKRVYAFDGGTYTNYNRTTDENGQASITLPEGVYRFRVDVDGTQFWSALENHCEIGRCGEVTVTIPLPVLVSVTDTDGEPKAGLRVYAFSGTAYTNFSATTDENGQVLLRLPEGEYRFRADLNGTQFWSGAENHCSVVSTSSTQDPGCTMASVQVTVPLTVLVRDNLSTPKAGIKVYAFSGTTYTNYSATTGEDGLATLTLPLGSYRFRADFNGTQFWSDTQNHCEIVSTGSTQVPGCREAEVLVSAPLFVNVLDTDGTPQAGIRVYAFNGNTYTNFNTTTDADGRATFTLPAGSYRFRADLNGTQFWSGPSTGSGQGTSNHCQVPDCEGASITVSKPVSVTVSDTNGEPKAGIRVYAFNGNTYTNFNTTTNAAGQATFTLPLGEYRFRADLNGTQFWSGASNHCVLPGCENAGVTVSIPLVVSIQDAGGAPQAGARVYAFNGATYTNYSATSNAEGQAVFTLPLGEYRFRADFNGVQYWSGAANHCTIPGCTSLVVTVGPQATATSTPTPTATAPVEPTPTAPLEPSPTATLEPTPTTTVEPVETSSPEPGETPTPSAWQPGGAKVLAAAQKQQPNQVTVTVLDTNDEPKAGLRVYVFSGADYTGYSGTTDQAGLVTFTLPDGEYRFRADLNGTRFWSADENHCNVPTCPSASVSVTVPVTVTVLDTDDEPKAGLRVYAFDGATYSNYSATTDADGQAVFTLPQGEYRFRADFNGTRFWSADENHCAIVSTSSTQVPNCDSASVTVTLPVSVTVLDSDGTPKAGLRVYAFDGATYTNYSATSDADGQVVFTLPQGAYRFRADLNGTRFWSGETNHCEVPNCDSASVTVSKPVTVTVAGQGGQPYPGLRVYAFTDSTYSGYSGTTDASGQVTFTLPLGEYRFRADYDGVQFWSSDVNACPVPGCETASVTLPGGTGESVVTIDYTYDPLRRLTSATYSNGISFHYTYDAAGNVLEYSATINGQTTVTSYQYDAANQLLTASKDSTVWRYTYDGNGSLVLSTPGETIANGAKRYTYNTAGFLLKVETYTNSWQTQAEMLYDGLGNRLQMTAAGLTTQYELDNGRVLSADAAGNVTYYLYGLGPIGELTTDWNYSLPDGSNTPRQLVDVNAEITFAASYTPWGDTLETFGTGRFTQGYFGGIMDAATGLIYVGNGQYYDPATGRFLTRDARPNQNNPYTPIDPTGALLGPLALLALAFGRKKSRGKWDVLVVLLVLSVSLGAGLSACEFPFPPSPTPTQPPASPPPTETPGSGNNPGSGTPTPPPPTEEPLHCSGELTKRGNKTAYLTIDDDGPYMEEIATWLKDQNMPSTFFVNGTVDVAQMQRIKNMGHAIGLHGMRHFDGVTPETEWSNPYFNVTKDVTAQKDKLASVIQSDSLLLRAPGGSFAPVNIFKNSNKWKPYHNAYFYGWDIGTPPDKLSNEPGYLATILPNGPDHAIILLHSTQPATRDAIVNGNFKTLLECSGYSKFSVLPGNYAGNHRGYPPLGAAMTWARDVASYTHFEENLDPIKP